MASLIVVVLEPWSKGGAAGVVGGEHLAVGPFGLQRPVEALDFPVLPGAMWTDEFMRGIQRGDRSSDGG